MADTDEPTTVWMYTPSFALAVIAAILYGLVFLWISHLTIIKYRAWFFICIVIGAVVEVAGYALRCFSIKNPTSVGPFAATLTLIVLAPIFISAANYLLLTRLILVIIPSSSPKTRILRIPARLLTRIFITLDIVSFFVQSGGSGVASSTEWEGNTGKIGVYILIGGLSLQALSFSFFLSIFGRFNYLVRRDGAARDAPRGWEGVVRGVWVSSVLILIRCIYRVAEFAEGVEGYSFRHEWLFWVFEALPMLVAIGIFCIYHPSACLGRDGGKSRFRGKIEGGDSEEGMATELRSSRRSSRRKH